MFTQVCFPHFAHFRRRRRPEKPASEELCYRLISHIGPLVCVGFLCQVCWTSCVAPHVCVLRTQLPTPSLNYSVDDSSRRRRVFHLFVLPGSIGHAHFTLYCTVLYCIAHGSSSLSPCGLVVAACSASAFLHFVSLECARLDVCEFYDLYWINKPLVGGGGSLKSHQFATARDFLVV